MSTRSSFKFKKFDVNDGQCAMKLGTDAVLLGAWANVHQTKSILDIGTGCGIIALLMCQRSNAMIDAIDIHEPSINQANENFINSPWPNRLNAILTSVQDFSVSSENKYDLIVCNPPFFTNDLKSPYELKNISKHNDRLPFDELILASAKLLKPGGKFSVILPVSSSAKFVFQAKQNKLYCRRETIIVPKSDKKPNRTLLEFEKKQYTLKESDSIMLRNKDGSYTKEYVEITCDFYLYP
ncbi:MAG: methyltransferase [Bacteroidales bacterium]